MEFELSDSGTIKTLARVFTGASKIGDDIMLSSGPQCVEMRTLNSTHSTSAKFVFRTAFFDRLSVPTEAATQIDVKVSTRLLLPIFRYPGGIMSVVARLNSEEMRVVVRSRSRLTKTYYVPLLDGRLGVTVVDTAAQAYLLRAPPHFMLEILANFIGRLDEITVAPGPEHVRFVSFMDDHTPAVNGVLTRQLRTEMCVPATEFINCDAGDRETTLTVFFKYFRAVLDFCDYFDCSTNFRYNSAGQPLVVDLDFESAGLELHFDVQFVFATRHVDDSESTASAAQSASRASNGRASGSRPSVGRSKQLEVRTLRYVSQGSNRPMSQLPLSQPTASQSNHHEIQQNDAEPEPEPEPMEDVISDRNAEPSPHTPAVPRRRLQADFDDIATNTNGSNQVATNGDSDINQMQVDTPQSNKRRRRRVVDENREEQDVVMETPSLSKYTRRSGEDDSNRQNSTVDESIPETPASQPHQIRRIESNKASESDEEFVEGTPPPE